jgi:hypothetical protein
MQPMHPMQPMLLKLTSLPRAPSCTQSTNDKTSAQLETEEHGFITVHLVRSSPPTATLAGLNDNFKAFMVAKVPSSKPLDPSIFVVSFNGSVYTLNIPKSLVPLRFQLPLLRTRDCRHKPGETIQLRKGICANYAQLQRRDPRVHRITQNNQN